MRSNARQVEIKVPFSPQTRPFPGSGASSIFGPQSPYSIHVRTFGFAGSVSFGVVMLTFDYAAPAELFPSRNRKVPSRVKYRRFARAAEAIQFAVEELPETLFLGTYIQIDERRLGHQDIRALYDSAAYPLKKKAAKKAA
jgi:hypothetical protein